MQRETRQKKFKKHLRHIGSHPSSIAFKYHAVLCPQWKFPNEHSPHHFIQDYFKDLSLKVDTTHSGRAARTSLKFLAPLKWKRRPEKSRVCTEDERGLSLRSRSGEIPSQLTDRPQGQTEGVDPNMPYTIYRPIHYGHVD